MIYVISIQVLWKRRGVPSERSADGSLKKNSLHRKSGLNIATPILTTTLILFFYRICRYYPATVMLFEDGEYLEPLQAGLSALIALE